MLNQFFLQGSKGEQGLLQDLINESLKIYGIDVYYLPRQYVTKKKIIREVIESEFNFAFPIEAYVETFDGYEGAGTLLTKFGIQPYTDLTITISKERYENYISPLIRFIPNIELPTRPKEGDLIYFPLGDRIFEIKFVEHEVPFYQLQKTYVYVMKCELFRYQDETISTGIDFIDNNVENLGFIQALTMIGAGSTASAVTSVVNGGVRYVEITNRGLGYKTPPTVIFSPPGGNGIVATGIASMIGGIVDLCDPDSTSYRVQSINITNPGAGYTAPPTVAFYGGGGKGAESTAVIGSGIIGIVTVTDRGSGYVDIPIVSFSGICSISAQARAVLLNGSIDQIQIINAGLGYSEAPTISISSPSIIGTGTYIPNETVIGGITSNTAIVKTWNRITNILEVSNLSGSFAPGEIITGTASGATYSVEYIGTIPVGIGTTNTSFTPVDGQNSRDPFAQNYEFQIEANKIIDFSQSNPFGNP
jgi:hypothetical protein